MVMLGCTPQPARPAPTYALIECKLAFIANVSKKLLGNNSSIQ
jgi:hypothetical protein